MRPSLSNIDTCFGLRQSYRSLDGSQVMGRFERSTISGNAFGNDVLDVLEGTYSKRLGNHALELSANHSSNTGGANGTQTDLTHLNGRHLYTPVSNLRLETIASYHQNDFQQSRPSLLGAFSNRYVQVASFGSWRSAEGEPWFDEDHPLPRSSAACATRESPRTPASRASGGRPSTAASA